MLAPSPSSEMGPKDGGKKSGSVEALAPKPQGSPPPRRALTFTVEWAGAITAAVATAVAAVQAAAT